MEPNGSDPILNVLNTLPSACCVMTAAYEGKRGGLLVHRVMACANEPPSIAIAVPKGQRLATLIRDSHAFAVNILSPSQRLIIKKFREIQLPEPGLAYAANDPFDTLELRTLRSGAPVLARAVAAIDCEVMRHFDLEADFEVYVGVVVAAQVLNPQPGATNGALSALQVGDAVHHHGGNGHSENGKSGNGLARNGHSKSGHAKDGHGMEGEGSRCGCRDGRCATDERSRGASLTGPMGHSHANGGVGGETHADTITQMDEELG